MPTNGNPNGRFELPQLTPVNFSLTDGTDIPPPPASPIENNRPAPDFSSPHSNGQLATNSNANGVYDGRGQVMSTNVSADQPTSPISQKRPSSIRRFLSRKSLNTNYNNGTNTNASNEDVSMIDRPYSAMSYASTTGPDQPKKKKSGSWFRRLSSNGGYSNNNNTLTSPTRTSIIYEDKQSAPKLMGPPPPKLPELNKLKARVPDNDDGSLGAEDMFKNIK